ncbi:hypothetical protein [Pseudomonas proteolytica]|uniref:hypothetical protein n=1 Tax=Pseudomonas proteolytica TaxID=219574 RepID=UPI00147540A1|nr:hypothetical protein [Pseudomonas proteolytica]NMY95646.1 hypothetical protein [Pseudomonas proteolytica]
MPKKPLRKTNKTVLFAVEGETDLAFMTHLKQCYIERNCKVSIKIKNAHGAGPLGIVDALMTGARGKSYDYFAALFDSDLPICKKSDAFFKKNSVQLFQSVPAIEGTLLRTANKKLKENITTAECKRILAQNFPGNSVDISFFERHFEKVKIEAARPRLQILENLIEYMINPK